MEDDLIGITKAKRGRPKGSLAHKPSVNKTKIVAVISEKHQRTFLKLGEGNLSVGVRRAAEIADWHTYEEWQKRYPKGEIDGVMT